MCAVLVAAVEVFAWSLAIHVIVWRIHRPESYRAWLPVLIVIFGPLAAGVAWLLGSCVAPGTDET